MANQFVKTNSFRQKIVNKRVDPAFQALTELLTDFRPLVVENNQVVQWYVILNECIYNEDDTGFKITYISGSQEIELVKGTDYNLNTESAVVTFTRDLDPQELNNLTAYYNGGGSIIWAEDVTDLQKVLATIDSNAVYTNGSNPMTADFLVGSGTYDNPYHSIRNVDTVDGIKLNKHNHTGVQTAGADIGKDYGAQIPTAGIENNAITENKIATDAVINSKIKASSVTNIKVANNTLTAEKLNAVMVGDGLKRSSSVIDGVTVSNAVLQTNIDNSTITYNNGVMQIPGIINLTGVVLPFAGSGTSIPAGWLLCDGSSYTTSQYARLFQVIGYTYGGSGSTFKVPNFVGKTFWGGINNDGIENQELLAGLPNIAGLIGVDDRVGHAYLRGGFYANGAQSVYNTSASGGDGRPWQVTAFSASQGECGTTKTITDGTVYKNNVYGNSETVQPPAIRMKFIIKT